MFLNYVILRHYYLLIRGIVILYLRTLFQSYDRELFAYKKG